MRSLRYGVSPQPAQAPENSNSGCEHLRALDGRGLHSGAVDLRDGEEVLPALALGVDVVELRQRVERLVLGFLVLSFAGQVSMQMRQPVQSSGETWMVMNIPGRSFARPPST